MHTLPHARRASLGWLCGLLLLAGCAEPAQLTTSRPPAGVGRTNVVLITIDTLRQDHLSSYGYSRTTTPFLDRLAREGVRFTRAYSTSSWTVPAVVSLLTSLDPASHGIEHGFITDDGDLVRQEVLLPEQLTLPELLRQAGYATFGATANGHLRASHGFAQGFDRYACLGFAGADDLAATIAGWSAQLRAAEPYFLWVHYFDPHGPYEPREPYLSAFRAAGPAVDDAVLQRIAGLVRRRDYDAVDLDDPAIRRAMLLLYDAEVRYTDAAVEALFDRLDVADDALIVVTADHGEEFLDHGDIWHAHSLYDELLRVPLIVRFPGGRHAGSVVDDPVSLLDVAPTIAGYLGLETPQRFQGIDLARWPEQRPAAARPIHATLTKVRTLDAFVADGYKYIQDLDRPEKSQLFDLLHDPGEQRNLIGAQVARAQDMARALRALIEERNRRRSETDAVALSAEEAEELRALGYVR